LNASLSFQKILFAFCAFIGLMVAVRTLYTRDLSYIFLPWNLFLAWIPFFISNLFPLVYDKKWWLQFVVFCCGLAFFPNALYIVTDLIHLEEENDVPKWFDAVLIFSSSVAGLMMAFVSLYRIEKYLCRHFSERVTTIATIFLVFLGSFGVYIGRFLRWNSWDIIGDPVRLFFSIGHRVVSPIDHVHTWATTFVFTVLFYLLYLAIKKLPGYLSQANM
jgi:uncharacterized membrane protein